jgi:SAM-dependent methyltransferase
MPAGFQRWDALADVSAAAERLAEQWRGEQAFERYLVDTGNGADLHGYCAACASEQRFAIQPGGDWRETLACRQCGLINRLRACVHLLRALQPSLPAGATYVSEQTTPFFDWLQTQIPDLIGSEYVDPALPSGARVDWQQKSLRHEDVTALSMAAGTLSAILSFEVLEHVPDYRTAIAEFARVLVPGGLLLLTAPFAFHDAATQIRAIRHADGSIEHLLPPDYHGDPLSERGVLCYQVFGWDLLTLMQGSGFAEVALITCWNPAFAYLGSFQPFVVAWR